jgi:predicted  nucleic acid-binding Zn-ribbon protein
MRKTLLLFLFLVAMLSGFAQKDINAWKKETNLENQFDVFKKNVNFWNGSYFMKPEQLNAFYAAIKDSVDRLENNSEQLNQEIVSLNNSLQEQKNLTSATQEKLDDSIQHQNAISIFGLYLHKNIYTGIMSAIILALLVGLGVVFMLYKRSHKITARTRKDYNELKEEYESHRKNALERYTKINTELHQTRLELNKK